MTRVIPSTVSAIAVALLLGLLPAPVTAQLQDQVYLHENLTRPTRGVIDEVTATIVKIRVNSVARDIAVNEIARITFADDPNELQQVRGMVRRKQYEAAKAELDKLNSTQQPNEWVRQDIQFFNALLVAQLAITGKADKNEAGRLLAAFKTEQKNSFHYYKAVELFGDLAASVGSFEAAAESYREVGTAPWPDYKYRAAVLEAGALVGKGDHAAALPKYEQVAAVEPTSEVMRQLQAQALAGKARCLGATGRVEAGIALAQKIIKDNDPKTQRKVMAQAYNAQGACYLANERPKDALISYLFTAELFYQDPNTHAEALYQLSKLWELEKKSERANRARGLLRERYGDSVWAKKP
jgi:tetratricopeptide (TPR) repeat protein